MKSKYLFISFAIIMLTLAGIATASHPPLTIEYANPAENYYEALPLGNGTMGFSTTVPAGRIAFVNDGNNADADDISAIPFQAAIIAAFNATDKLVHWTYACDLKATDSTREKELNTSLKGAVSLWGDSQWGEFDPSIFFNYQNAKSEAENHLTAQINASSSDDPLWIIEASEPDVIGYALEAADENKRQYVKVITHHPHNDGGVYWHLTRSSGGRKSIAALPGMAADFIVRIPDQNTELRVPESNLSWAENSSDLRIKFLWNRAIAAQYDHRNPPSGIVDFSDAGMVWYILDGGPVGGGDETPSINVISDKLITWTTANPSKE